MKNPIFLSVLLTLIFSSHILGQDKMSWKQHVKLAETLYGNGQFEDAAEHYQAAWKKKTKKKEYIYKAGECYFLVRDYRNAADSWQHVKNDFEDYPMIGLQYARSLKQNGDYEAASSELVNFLGQYQGADKAVVSEIVQNELRGCELAAQFAVKGDDENIQIDYLSANINTPETEFAPMPFGDEALYFSSTMGKKAEIYRSIKSGNIWGKATPIENFPKLDDHFCNGTLTPDASRFYFTICNDVESWGGRTSQCALYVSRRLGKAWTNPERLPDYLNEVNTTTTHPFVIHQDKTEILYFSSNRKGGIGGMDIWYTTREINSTANDFTLPINAGSKINTIGDEITPYYNKVDDAIYFASNGQVSIGGFDIFKSKGSKSRWAKAENVGRPINSSADDFFFVKTTSGKGGFLVSNRLHEMEKVTTTDEDIFEFTYQTREQRWVAKGEVYSKQTKEILNDVEVVLFEVDMAGESQFVDKIFSATGMYEMEVEPAKRYKLEVKKDGHFPKTYEFDTRDYAEYDDFGAPIFLEPHYEGYQEEAITSVKNNVPQTNVSPTNKPATAAIPPAPKKNEREEPVKTKPYDEKPDVVRTSETVAVAKPKTDVPVKTTVPSTPPPAKTTPTEVVNPEASANGKTATGSGVENPIPSPSPSAGKTYYKIQIIALSNVNKKQSRFNLPKQMGELETEKVPNKGLYRVLIADYNSPAEAKNDLARIRKYRDFSDAFLVEYKDGQRIRDIH
ncbi:MAG: SPOR domain-containing protein [Bacteroidota bacterium]